MQVVQYRLDMGTPQNLANIMWSCVVLGYMPDREWMVVYYYALDMKWVSASVVCYYVLDMNWVSASVVCYYALDTKWVSASVVYYNALAFKECWCCAE